MSDPKSSTNATEMAQRAAKGEMPTNKQLDTAIERASESLERSAVEQPLSSQTKRAVHDTQQILQDTQEFIKERNEGEHIQKIARSGKKLGEEAPVSQEMRRLEKEMGLSEREKERLRQETSQGVTAARNLAMELIRSGDFRRTFIDVVEIFNEILVQNLRENFDTEQVESKVKEGAQKQDEDQAKHKLKEAGKQVQKEAEEFEVKISDDQKQKLNERFNSILNKVANNDNFNKAANNLFVLLNDLQNYTDFWRRQAEKDVQYTLRQMYMRQIWTETKEFIEEFTGPENINNLIDSVKEFTQMVVNDTDLKQYFSDLQQYVEESLENPQLLQEESHRNKVNEMIDRGREFMQNQEYRNEVNSVFEYSQNAANQIRQDPIIQNLANDLQRIFRDVGTDAQGNVQFKPEILAELKNVLVPLIMDQLQNVPMAPIVESNEKYDYAIDHIVFSGQEILPSQVLVESAMNMKIGVRPQTIEKSSTSSTGKTKKDITTEEPTEAVTGVLIKAKDMRANLKDVNVWYHRKTFPEIEDTCRLNVDMGESGADITLLLEIQNPQKNPLLRLHNVDCTVHSLNIDMVESSANWLYNLLMSVFKGSIKESIEDGVEKRVSRFFFAVNQEMQKAVENVDVGSVIKETATPFTQQSTEPKLHA